MLLAGLLIAAQPVESAPAMFAPLGPLGFLTGHCWQGEIAPRRTDEHCFDAVLGGRAVRDRHRVTGGYAGETLYSWNGATRRIDYSYWNNDGGVARGSLREHDGLLDFGDGVYRDQDGRQTRVPATWRKIDERTYETRSPAAAGARVVRYVRMAPGAIRVHQVSAADGTRTLIHEAVIQGSPANVYDMLIRADGWETWAVPHAWIDPNDPDLLETGYAPDAQQGAAANIKQRFILRVPDRLVAFRTVQTPAGFPHADAYKRVTTVIELEPIDGGTRLRLSGIGYPPGAAGDELLAFFREGNHQTLEQLQARFVTGPIDWAARGRAAAAR